MSDYAIKVDNVSKLYKLYDKPMDRLKDSLGLSRKKKYKEHLALNNVNLTVKKGETVGIIGTNGSGKSTILKIIAAMFIHVFFICVLLLIACVYGYYPSVYWIQILYYMACEFILVLSLSYATCAIVVFFRDLLQIINIGLQLFQWGTPILWNINIVPDKYKWIFKLNPMTYIVEGYRNAIYGDTWFFEHFYSSTYFWIFVVATFCIGTLIFKRSKPHFADVL